MNAKGTIIYNAILFVVACALLGLAVPRLPLYKIAITSIALGIIAINVLTMVLFYVNEQQVAAMKKTQQANIVPAYCPDYWTKATTTKGVTCQSTYAPPSKQGQKVYTFGTDQDPKNFDLGALAAMPNNDKCNMITASKISWVDMRNKCASAGM